MRGMNFSYLFICYLGGKKNSRRIQGMVESILVQSQNKLPVSLETDEGEEEELEKWGTFYNTSSRWVETTPSQWQYLRSCPMESMESTHLFTDAQKGLRKYLLRFLMGQSAFNWTKLIFRTVPQVRCICHHIYASLLISWKTHLTTIVQGAALSSQL